MPTIRNSCARSRCSRATNPVQEMLARIELDAAYDPLCQLAEIGGDERADTCRPRAGTLRAGSARARSGAERDACAEGRRRASKELSTEPARCDRCWPLPRV